MDYSKTFCKKSSEDVFQNALENIAFKNFITVIFSLK